MFVSAWRKRWTLSIIPKCCAMKIFSECERTKTQKNKCRTRKNLIQLRFSTVGLPVHKCGAAFLFHALPCLSNEFVFCAGTPNESKHLITYSMWLAARSHGNLSHTHDRVMWEYAGCRTPANERHRRIRRALHSEKCRHSISLCLWHINFHSIFKNKVQVSHPTDWLSQSLWAIENTNN